MSESSTVGLSYPPERSLNLDPKDWFWATWRNLTPLERSTPKPFNLKDCLNRFRRTAPQHYRWSWSKAKIAPVLSREEAHFWFAAISEPKRTKNQTIFSDWVSPEDLVTKFASQSFDGNLSSEQVKQSSPLLLYWDEDYAARMAPLITLLSAEDFIGLVEQEKCRFPICYGFRTYILPYLSEAEIESLRSRICDRLVLNDWNSPNNYPEPTPDFFLAAYLGLHDELLKLIESWHDDTFRGANQYLIHHQRPQEIIFGLKEPHLVEHHIKRLGLKLQPTSQSWHSSTYIRAWLAHTEFSALELIRDTVLAARDKEEMQALFAPFTLVQAPEAAPLMLELMLSSKIPQLAKQWLQDNPTHAIAGLIPVAAKRGKLADAAIEFLHTMKRKGYDSYIQTCLNALSIKLDLTQKEYIPFNSQITPQWLATATAINSSKQSWNISPSDLPPITSDQHCFNETQIEAVLNALRQSKLDSPHPLILAIQANLDRANTDAFAWKLFESWLNIDAPSKEKWAMFAVGLLGSDASVLKLAPLIRLFPGQAQHHRAVIGLECLKAIGTDTALMQINSIAQTVKFRGLKQAAQNCMNEIAQSRNMTQDQVGDRIIPTCGLDQDCVFDFGSRQFYFALEADLKPIVKDNNGKIKPNLPRPGAKDDPKKAQSAISAWKLLKKQVNEVIKIQVVRLEQAMVTGRHWQLTEFETLLVQHPLMRHLVQRLIWSGYDPSNQITTFRVTEDQTYADINDNLLDLSKMEQISLTHPLDLTEPQRTAWGEILSNYKIISPFVQMGRSIYQLEVDEATQTEITRFKDTKIPAFTLTGTLSKLGWITGVIADAGIFSDHSKPFYGADITAVVEYDGVPIGYVDGWNDQSIERCFFVKGVEHRYCDRRNAIALQDVDPIVISEVLRDLSAIQAS
ncbi:MAG: DUF4132 domain-containing protein [Leptolyngbya sp. Prado105]|jgi:hypothetical protein|nr:DUF4132 domain-containing protein [Leptolyngbya sp. Prado105]